MIFGQGILRILAALVKPFSWALGLIWVRHDAAKDAQNKAELQAHERLNDVQDTSDLTDAERVKRLSELGKRLGG